MNSKNFFLDQSLIILKPFQASSVNQILSDLSTRMSLHHSKLSKYKIHQVLTQNVSNGEYHVFKSNILVSFACLPEAESISTISMAKIDKKISIHNYNVDIVITLLTGNEFNYQIFLSKIIPMIENQQFYQLLEEFSGAEKEYASIIKFFDQYVTVKK